MSQQERRLNPRTRVGRLTYIALPSDNGGIATDVSQDGLGFCAVAAAEASTSFPVSLQLYSSGGLKLVTGLVEVAWTDATGKRGGLRFKYLPNESRNQLRRWQLELDARPTDAEEQPCAARPVSARNLLHTIGELARLSASRRVLRLHQSIMAPIAKMGAKRNPNLLTLIVVSILAGATGFVSNTWYHDIKAERASQPNKTPNVALADSITTRQVPPEDTPALVDARFVARPTSNSSPDESKKSNKPKMIPKAAQALAEDDFIFVQLRLFSEQGEAQNLIERLHSKNFVAYASQIEGSTFYRVQLGPYTTDEAANAAQTALRKAGFDSFIRKTSRQKP